MQRPSKEILPTSRLMGLRANSGCWLTLTIPKTEMNEHRSKFQALSSAERDQIFGGANLFLSIALKELLALVCPIYSH